MKDKMFKAVIAFQIAMVILSVAAMVAVVWAAIHFAHKYW